MSVLTGLDVMQINGFRSVRNANIGILANQASVDKSLCHIVDIILDSHSCSVTRLFAPEHGFRGALQDMEAVGHSVDSKSKLPIISLYGTSEETLAPSLEHLEDLDILVVDLQDIGSRYYTFAQTLAYCMKQCSLTNTKVVVIDRPNPIDGVTIEGASIHLGFDSFCGYAPVPNRHGLTMGELARLIQRGLTHDDYNITPICCELEIIKMQGWDRKSYFDETGLTWVLPSPNMPTLDTAIVYPGACLIEATQLSEARGTTKPFEFIGAPYINGHQWADETIALCKEKDLLDTESFALRPLTFIPCANKHKGKTCGGLQLHVLNRNSFYPLRCYIALLYTVFGIYPHLSKWRSDTYEFKNSVTAIDLLYGSTLLRTCIESQSGLESVVEDMKAFEAKFQEIRTEFMLY